MFRELLVPLFRIVRFVRVIIFRIREGLVKLFLDRSREVREVRKSLRSFE